MPNKRATSKKLIGAQASVELRRGVDEWLLRNPGKSQTDFLLMASVDKLQNEGIAVDLAEVFRDGRLRVPQPAATYPDPTPPAIMNEPSSAKVVAAAEESEAIETVKPKRKQRRGKAKP